MGNTLFVRNVVVSKGAAAAAGGTFVATLTKGTDFPDDRLLFVRARAYLTRLVAGHLSDAEGLACEGWISCKNGTTALVPVIPGGTNPINSGTFLGRERAQAADASMLSGGGAPGTLVATAGGAGGTIVLTATNNSAAVIADVQIEIEIESCGST